jgi:hypothetical protein
MSKLPSRPGSLIRPFHPTVGARLLEIDAHHDLQPVGQFFAQGGQPSGVVDRGSGIMHGAGADDDQKSIVGAVEDGVDGVARGHHDAGGGQRARHFAHYLCRRAQFLELSYS